MLHSLIICYVLHSHTDTDANIPLVVCIGISYSIILYFKYLGNEKRLTQLGSCSRNSSWHWEQKSSCAFPSMYMNRCQFKNFGRVGLQSVSGHMRVKIHAHACALLNLLMLLFQANLHLVNNVQACYHLLKKTMTIVKLSTCAVIITNDNN